MKDVGFFVKRYEETQSASNQQTRVEEAALSSSLVSLPTSRSRSSALGTLALLIVVAAAIRLRRGLNSRALLLEKQKPVLGLVLQVIYY